MAGTQMQLEDWLDDLCVRFIINLPEEDLSSVARICFQVEEAQWFYEDFIRPLDPNLPSMSLRTFCLQIFQHCPLLASFSVENHTRAFEEFLQYKTRIPVRGAILLNHDMDSTVLVKGYKKGANWSFPRGKINKDEDDLDCAIREVWEETGLDLRAAGLVPAEDNPKYIEITMREQQIRLYVFRDVPMDTDFQPQTRKEISRIQWYKLSELPAFRKKGAHNHNQSAAGSNTNKFYMVAPFLVPLKKWVVSQKKLKAKKAAMLSNTNPNPHFSLDEAPTEDDALPLATTAVPMQTPAIDTLEGATHELQRLLKVQPATQGLQSPRTQDDKASALLSMLQAGAPPPPEQLQGKSQMPHTALELTSGDTPQPSSPYHTNQHHILLQNNQPPASFHIGHHHSHHQHQQVGPLGTTQTQTHTHAGKAPPQESEGAHQQLKANHQAPLVHPQPLPPQVQRSMFNKSTFQENPSAATAHGAQHQPSLPHHAHNPAPHPNGPTNEVRPAQLDGQSLALLNAFKRDTGNAPSTEAITQPQAPQVRHASSQFPSYNQQAPATQGLHQPSELAGSVAQKVHANPPRPDAAAPVDPHRSTLLGMFKGNHSDAVTKEQAAGAPHVHPSGSGREKQLLDMFRREPPGTDAPSKAPPEPSDPSAAMSNFVALKQQTDQTSGPKPGTGEHTVPMRHGQSSTGSQTPSNPMRILQRGQTAESLGIGGQPVNPPRHSPYSNQSQPGSAGFASPPVGVSLPSPDFTNRRPEASQDQKRQLLSLFGKQRQGASGNDQVSSGNRPPSRPGSGTPISPADQTFLLDYLQSVTNNTSR